MRLCTLLLVATVTLFSAAATAGDIYINGQQVRGITNLTIEGCQVTFNARGDVYITAPDFQVLATAAQGEQSKVAVTPETMLSARYFLFTRATERGKVPYNFEVWINGQLAKKFTSSEDQVTQELTLFFAKGENKIEVKSLYQGAAAGTAADVYSIVVGRGQPIEGSLEINEVLLNYARKGCDTGDANDVFLVEVK